MLPCALLLLALGPTWGAGASAEQATPASGGGNDASISFRVGVCPPGMSAFGEPVQVDGAPNCDGTGLAGNEPPLAGGVVTLTAVETGAVYTINLDGNGSGSATIPGGLTYVASISSGGNVLTSRSGCGSAQSGLAGPAESGVFVASGEAMSCTAVTLMPAAPTVANTIILTVRGCPGATDASGFLVGDGVLDCNGDPSTKESIVVDSGTATFQNATAGTSTDAAIDSTGTASSGPVDDGAYVVSLARGGIGVPFASVCGGKDAGGTPLGLLGGIGDPGAPLTVTGGETIQCSILVALGPGASSGTPISTTAPASGLPASAQPIAVSMALKGCDAAFSIVPSVQSGTVADLSAITAAFASGCTTPISLPGQQGTVTPVGASAVHPGTLVSSVLPAGTKVLWGACAGPSGQLVPMLSIPEPDGTLLLLPIPLDFAGPSLACTVYLETTG